MKLYLYTIHKTNSKLIKDLNIRSETIRLLEKKKGEKLHDIGLGNNIMDMTPKAQAAKTQINNQDYIKPQKLLHSKGNNQQSGKATYRMGVNVCKLYI